jgi:hypothetical protein
LKIGRDQFWMIFWAITLFSLSSLGCLYRYITAFPIPDSFSLLWSSILRLRRVSSSCWVLALGRAGRPLGFYRISTTKKKTRISTKYRPHSTLSTKYRPQKFLEKRTFTIFTFKSWDIHILGKWGLSWNMRDKWGLFQLRTFRKALYPCSITTQFSEIMEAAE